MTSISTHLGYLRHHWTVSCDLIPSARHFPPLSLLRTSPTTRKWKMPCGQATQQIRRSMSLSKPNPSTCTKHSYTHPSALCSVTPASQYIVHHMSSDSLAIFIPLYQRSFCPKSACARLYKAFSFLGCVSMILSVRSLTWNTTGCSRDVCWENVSVFG